MRDDGFMSMAIAAAVLIAASVWLATHRDIPTVYSIPGLQHRIEALEARVTKLEACDAE